jgi:transcriptional regulator with XRE-family HTH domain
LTKDIGGKVKELRTAKKITLKQLSEQTNLSTGFLSQLERGLTSIATDSLAAIAAALEVELAYFFIKPTRKGQHIVRSYERELLQVENGSFIHYCLTTRAEEKNMLPRLVELLPVYSQEDISQYSHEGEEFVYVLEGTLTLLINHERYELYPGDTAHYSSSIMHNWTNCTNKVTKLLVVHTPNPFCKAGGSEHEESNGF